MTNSQQGLLAFSPGPVNLISYGLVKREKPFFPRKLEMAHGRKALGEAKAASFHRYIIEVDCFHIYLKEVD